MKKILSWFTLSVIFRLLGRQHTQNFIEKYLRYSNSNLLPFAHRQLGIMKWQNLEVSGETWLIQYLLPRIFSHLSGDSLELVDVGANKGEYAAILRLVFPKARLHVFEPNPKHAHTLLNLATGSGGRIVVNQLALSANNGHAILHVVPQDVDAALASLQQAVVQQLHGSAQTREISVTLQTLDDYCLRQGVQHIHFLKIDTEGHELEVLKGATSLIARHAIDIIQFEFNEMNVMARVFLKDFYEILPDYQFYRLDTDRLIPLREYNPIHEIFQFQNIIAIHPSVQYV